MVVYLLHFKTPLAHAQHYVGSTSALRQRLLTHAQGGGARLTEELKNQHIDWAVGGLWQTTAAQARRKERELKESKNAPQYCDICSGNAAKNLPGCPRYPAHALKFPTTRAGILADPSVGQKALFEKEPRQVREARDKDMDWVIRLAAEERHQVGFIPHQSMRTHAENSKVLIGLAGRKGGYLLKAGYLLFTTTHNRTQLKIQQTATTDNERLRGIGKALVAAARAHYPDAETWARVRDDLPANFFWQAIGFNKLRSETHKTSGHLINVYHKPAGN